MKFPALSSTQDWHYALPGPENVTRRKLPNGIIFLARPNFDSPSVVLSGYLLSGSLSDPDEKLGLADFASSALIRGNTRRDFQQTYDALESAGARLGINGGIHVTSFSGKALAEDLDLLLDILNDSLRYPTFPTDQVERLRAQLLTGLAIRAQDTGEMASMLFDEIVYVNHPYRRPSDGYPETIAAITRQDLIDFHARNYGPRGMVVGVVGAVDPEYAFQRVSAVLGDWENPQQPEPLGLPGLVPLEATTTRHWEIPGKSQADIVLGVAGPPRLSPDFMAASLGNSVLGQFGMMGRIGKVVREQAGLAYYASSSLTLGVGPGPWNVAAGVAPGNVERAVDLIQQEIARFTSEPVSSEELADSQANFIGRLPLTLESNSGVAAALVSLERFGLDLDYYLHYKDDVLSVTVEDVLETARRYFDPQHLAVASAGP